MPIKNFTPGEIATGIAARRALTVGSGPLEVTGDKGYDRAANHAAWKRWERSKVERKFAEGNQRHGLKKARYRGLARY